MSCWQGIVKTAHWVIKTEFFFSLTLEFLKQRFIQV
uniref:Uncharacterized protein n=1 Tax=Rhizophora mucronata TaxID=61149 RepID=A0A2P2PYA3_RHIMU